MNSTIYNNQESNSSLNNGTIRVPAGTPVINHEGAEAFTLPEEMELYSAVANTLLSPMFYEGRDQRVDRIAALVKKCDPVFVAQLAVYARTQMNLRSVPLLLAVELAKVHSGDDLVSRMVSRIVLRADEIMELLTCYRWRNPLLANGKIRKGMGSLSRQIQLGLQQAFNRFDEYQFAKYNNERRVITLRDALFLTHPKAKSEEQQAIFNRIASETLDTPYTWEAELSEIGKLDFASKEDKNTAFAQKWAELILSGRVGYMALLRNLRNILKLKDIPEEAMERLIATLADKKSVLASKQFPFRFVAAYEQIKHIKSVWTPRVIAALEDAVRYSTLNIAGFSEETRVVIATDTSGSMDEPISEKSSMRLYKVGMILSMLLRARCENAITGIFADSWLKLDLPSENILANVQTLKENVGKVGYSTNGHKVIDYLIRNRIETDKVMFFTDCQLWDSTFYGGSLKDSWHLYKEEIAPKAQLYLFDLAGYGQTPVSVVEDGVYIIAGWSDKVFDLLKAIENGSSAVEEINKIQL